VLTTVKVNHS